MELKKPGKMKHKKKFTPPDTLSGKPFVSAKRSLDQRPHALSCKDKSLTHQQFKEDCDIKSIMEKYAKTGEINQNGPQPTYGDFANVPDYQNALNLIITAQEQFAALPADLRQAFNNSPEQFLDWATDKTDEEILKELGIDQKTPPPEAVKEPGDATVPEPPVPAPKKPADPPESA